MSEPRSETAFEARLRDLLAAELRAAEAAYGSLRQPVASRTRRRLPPVGVVVALPPLA